MSTGKRTRNSSIELLRILAMLMIVTSHCVMFSDLNVLSWQFSVNKVLIETFLYSGGKIGVVSFFAISAWFLTDQGGVRAGLRRVWILEREMLFWSLVLSTVTAISQHERLSSSLIVQSLFPTVTALWWYPTAYAVFLLFFPFLSCSLKSLDRTMHGALCVIMFVLWTVVDMVMPLSGVGLHGGDVFSFIYIYTLITYYRWHMQPLGGKQAWAMLVGGYAFIAIGAIAGGLVFQKIGKLPKLQVYLGSVEFRLPVLMVGIALFVLFSRKEFHSGIINTVAASTFGVYLISEYPTMRQWIWHSTLVEFVIKNNAPIIFGLLILLACVVFISCSLLDQVRALLFSLILDRHRGRWFDALYEYVSSRRHNAIQTDLRR
ncbi:acyltransferase family protein [Bifidobacterium reuteri]|uniref:acyltransferase family protein n=1 Tax=Bifidobacterium reuteri TaxID=983706 RepID=UPI00168B7C7A|nr:acyltransferase [Bifidobacterium reuteri]